MPRKILEHIISVLLVGAFLIGLTLYFNRHQARKEERKNQKIERWLHLDFINFDDPTQRALLKEMLDLYEPLHEYEHQQLMAQINQYRMKQVLEAARKNYGANGLTRQKLYDLALMYLKFILVYGVTLLLTYYGVQTVGTYRFIRFKQKRFSYLQDMVKSILHLKEKGPKSWKVYFYPLLNLVKAVIHGAAYFILFSPAYVIAYSFKTRFDTSFLVFMVVLGVISNAMLITYAHKFYTFLVSESRKGYVETAVVKNLRNSYAFDRKTGIALAHIFALTKKFPGHVFDHIYDNARFQYLPAIKEQASFLITGLIIIEMALNIQNHLCYELLQNILYKNYAEVTLIVLGIYLLVKTTEAGVDFILAQTQKRLG